MDDRTFPSPGTYGYRVTKFSGAPWGNVNMPDRVVVSIEHEDSEGIHILKSASGEQIYGEIHDGERWTRINRELWTADAAFALEATLNVPGHLESHKTICEPPHELMRFPIREGYTLDGKLRVRGERGFTKTSSKVVGRERVETPAGSFLCWKTISSDRNPFFPGRSENWLSEELLMNVRSLTWSRWKKNEVGVESVLISIGE